MDALVPARDVPTAMVALIAVGLGILITWFVVTRYVKRAIAKVIAGMQRIARGDLAFRLTVRRKDKFSVVADTFNDMASKLELLLHRLRETNAYMEGIVESSADIIVTVDRSGLIRTFNTGAEVALGYAREEVIGQRIDKLFADPQVREDVIARLKDSDQVVNYEAGFLTKSGDTREVISSIARLREPMGFTIGTFAIGKDVTNERKLQRQLIQSERYIAIGQSFAALQHSMKNMLNALPGGSYMVRKGIEKGDWDIVNEGWEIVAKGISSIRDLSKNLLRYVKDWEPELASVPVDNIINEIADVFTPTAADSGIAFSAEAHPDLPRVRCDASLIHSAIMDILSNALEACLSKEYQNGRSPRIDLAATHVQESQRVAIEIRDNGPGMTEKVKGQIFTPFFSTKKQKGTGLGLALTSRIVSLHGATIDVSSEPGQGAAFRILLPVAAPDQIQETGDGQESTGHR
ncbi:MAG: sensor histidine kinase [Planctomycetota bacterium]|jgi:PAS domain S-box-containing protein